jgi:sugar phosphate permease
MNRLSALLRPAPHVARLPEDQVGSLHPKFRWRILESTFVGYATLLRRTQ